jgi:hypothetical protein
VRSIDTLKKAIEIRDLLKKAMPIEEGFQFTITKWCKSGVNIES